MKTIHNHEVLPLVQAYVPNNPIIVEAGAFNGRDTQRLAAHWPKGTVHSFEPVPAIFELLTTATCHLNNVHRYQHALSSHNGTATFNISEHPKKPGAPYPAGSLLVPKERLAWSQANYTHTIDVTTVTLDTWMKQYHIPYVDFLWLDMQGHELAVLQAAEHVLKNVRVIFTEVEFIEAYAGQPLYDDVRTWLEHHGFTVIAKDFKDTSSWFFGNILCVRTDLL